MLSIFDIIALLVSLSALFGWLNLRFFNLPHTIGLLIMAMTGSLLMLGVEQLFPQLGIASSLQEVIRQIDLYVAVMNGMLAFLLFAGALHVDFGLLRDQKWAIVLMATVGVLISTAVIGTAMYFAINALGFPLPLPWALIFAALISPTDPVAVLALLKSVKVPEPIKVKIAGESLFNDGIAVVAFTVLLAVALGTGGQGEAHIDPLHMVEVFLFQGVGAVLFGLLTGWIAYRAMLSVDDHIVEILISIAACAATYALSLKLHVSGPIAVVVTGLFIGNHGAEHAMSEKVEEALFAFWEVIDEMLNSVLFLLIGLEVLVMSFQPAYGWIVLVAIPIVLLGRLVSVSLPILLLAIRQTFSPGSIPILTWGGLRGGVSVALALSLPDSDAKPVILTATYAVVIFSIIVQGLTMKWMIRRTVDPATL